MSATSGIADLPDKLLVRCLGFVSLRERLHAALTCKRFAAAACSPELLHDVDAGLIRCLWALRSLSVWLGRHGQHVLRLSLSCFAEKNRPADVAAALASCLATAAASGQLQQLNVEGRLHSTEWLAATRSLRHLTLRDADGRELLISPGIGSLTALRSLALGGYPLLLPVGARLPASITWLSLGGDYATEVPAQVNQLTQLARLSLSYPVYPPASLPQLPHLSSGLTRLDVTYGRLVPAASTLTRLRHLHAAECMLGGDDAETIDTVLRSLTQLTCLVLMGAGLDTPAALSSLPQLQRCYLQHTDQRAAGGERAQPLPPGSWLRSLRWLGASIDVLAASMAALQAAASALELIEVGDAESLQPVGWLAPGPTAVIEWLSRHPPLQKASFLANADRLGPSPAFDSRGFAARFAQLCRRRPGLRVRCMAGAGDFRQSMLELLTAESDFLPAAS